MASAYWQHVVADGRRVPPDRPLDELTADLTRMLGDPDPEVRGGIAVPTLRAWIRQGVYDDLLRGLGDGMAAGLDVGIGSRGDDTVFRRSSAALVLGECVERDAAADLLPAEQVLRWGDRLVAWLLRERDLRAFVPDRGWAHALVHGADALAALARSPRLGRTELVVLLDVLADRLELCAEEHLVAGEPDRLAGTCLQVLRRDLVGLEVLEPWVRRVALAATPATEPGADGGPVAVAAGNAQAFLRSLHLQLALAPSPPAVRADLLLVLIEQLRASNLAFLRP